MTAKRDNRRPIWVIRAGRSDEKGPAHTLFVDHTLIVLAKQDMEDLSRLPKERNAFYAAYGSKHADEGRTAIAGIGGKFFRFVHEIKAGDFVLYPCRLDKRIYLGQAAGSYFYDPTDYPDFPHRRKIRWLGSFPKLSLSEGAFRELGAARTLFQLKTHVAEVRRLICQAEEQAVRKSRRRRASSGS